MPKIDLCFNGWVRGANVTKASRPIPEEDGCASPVETIDVSHLSADELVAKLKSGELFISLADCLDDNREDEVELSDYEPHL